MPAIPFDEYRGARGVNWSNLKHMRQSPLHYRHAVYNPSEDTARFGIGRAIHAAILQPDTLASEFAVFDGKARKGKAWDEFEAEHAGKTILKRDEMDGVMAVAQSVRKHSAAMAQLSLSAALIERPITWTDPVTGLTCKALPDAVSSTVVDLKSTQSVEERIFRAQAARLGYFGQLAFYRRGYLALTKLILPCAIVAVEVNPPHDVGVFVVDDDSLRVADDEISRLLGKVAECTKTGEWPGRYPTARKIELPAWARGGDDVEAINFFGEEAA